MFSKLFPRNSKENKDTPKRNGTVLGNLFTARTSRRQTTMEKTTKNDVVKIDKVEKKSNNNLLTGFLTGRKTPRKPSTSGLATVRNAKSEKLGVKDESEKKTEGLVSKVLSAITPRGSTKKEDKIEKKNSTVDKIPTIEEESFLEVKPENTENKTPKITTTKPIDEKMSTSVEEKQETIVTKKPKKESISKKDLSKRITLTRESSAEKLDKLSEEDTNNITPEEKKNSITGSGNLYKTEGDDHIQLFHKAAALGDLQKLKKFLKGRDAFELLSSTDKDSSTALHKAASKNKFQAVKLLLDNGAQVDALDKVSSTPLHWACAGGNLESTQMLCKYNAQVNIRDKYGYAPLHLCLRKKAYRCADFLLLMGADINFKRGDGSTVLHVACDKGDLSTLQWLMSKPKIIANRRDKAGDTPVMLAGYKGHVKLVEFLMKKDLQSCRIRNEQNENLLHKAASGGHKQVIFLIASLSPVTCSAMMNETDLWGRTPLHQAVRDKQFQIVKTLLTMGADMDTQDNSGNTPIHDAVKVQDSKIVKFLVQSGCKFDIKNKNGETAKQNAKKVSLESYFND
eukprot:gene6598-10761_t